MNSRFRVGLLAAVGVPVLAVLAATGMLQGDNAAPETRPYTTWSDYGGTADSMQDSASKQIDKSNVKEQAPQFPRGVLPLHG